MPVKPLLEVPVFEPVTPNSLLTISMIEREAIRLFRNANYFLQTVGTEFDDDFAAEAEIGSSLRIRLPNDYEIRA